MLQTTIRRSLVDDPNGAMLSVVEAAAALGVSDGKICVLVANGTLTGKFEDGRIIAVSRHDVRRALRLT
jgi:excisionase family DNA binding protein